MGFALSNISSCCRGCHKQLLSHEQNLLFRSFIRIREPLIIDGHDLFSFDHNFCTLSVNPSDGPKDMKRGCLIESQSRSENNFCTDSPSLVFDGRLVGFEP